MPRPWPLLHDSQDPASLEARVAYHLHRLGLAGRALKASGFIKPHKAHLVSQGRLALTPLECADLEIRFGLSPGDLTRALTGAEHHAWTYYRLSARDRLAVWLRAQEAWQRAGLTTTQAAGIMRIAPPHVSSALKTRGSRILALDEAMRLVTALGLPCSGTPFIEPARAAVMETIPITGA